MFQEKILFSWCLGVFAILLITPKNTYAAGSRCGALFLVQESVVKNDQEEMSSREQIRQSLSREEFSMIQNYTHTSFGEINGLLRGTKSTEDILKVCGQGCVDLISALMKMPNYEGTVYRGTKLSRDQIDSYAQVGAIVTDHGFLSTSKDRKISGVFHKNAMFIIESKTGKDMEHVSVNPYEKEVIFLPGTKFRVESIIDHYADVTIHLVEVQ